MMLGRNVGELTAAGWLLAIASLACMVLVSIPVGQWVLDTIDRSTLRSWITVLVFAFALPGLAAGVLVFIGGERFLERLGIRVRRTDAVRRVTGDEPV